VVTCSLPSCHTASTERPIGNVQLSACSCSTERKVCKLVATPLPADIIHKVGGRGA
jgi:hypothetical protein